MNVKKYLQSWMERNIKVTNASLLEKDCVAIWIAIYEEEVEMSGQLARAINHPLCTEHRNIVLYSNYGTCTIF